MTRVYRHRGAANINEWLRLNGISYTRWRDLPSICPQLPQEHYRDPIRLWAANRVRAIEVAGLNADALHTAAREYARSGIMRAPGYTLERYAAIALAEAGERIIAAYCYHQLRVEGENAASGRSA